MSLTAHLSVNSTSRADAKMASQVKRMESVPMLTLKHVKGTYQMEQMVAGDANKTTADFFILSYANLLLRAGPALEKTAGSCT